MIAYNNYGKFCHKFGNYITCQNCMNLLQLQLLFSSSLNSNSSDDVDDMPVVERSVFDELRVDVIVAKLFRSQLWHWQHSNFTYIYIHRTFVSTFKEMPSSTSTLYIYRCIEQTHLMYVSDCFPIHYKSHTPYPNDPGNIFFEE